jgi:tRNA (mo5U34)-methyltransferase
MAPHSIVERTHEEIRVRIEELGPWFHNLELRGVKTAPDHFLGDYPAVKWKKFADALPDDLRGKSVLDVGCNAGFYSIEMKRRGADHVLGVDTDPDYIAQARFASEMCGVDIELRVMSVFDLPQLHERFDLVLFLGVAYHLRYPLLALDILHDYVVRDTMAFQSMIRGSPEIANVQDDYDFWHTDIFDDPGFPRLHFVEKSYSGDPTNWWIPNRACVEAMLRSAGFIIAAHPEDEVYICRPVQR